MHIHQQIPLNYNSEAYSRFLQQWQWRILPLPKILNLVREKSQMSLPNLPSLSSCNQLMVKDKNQTVKKGKRSIILLYLSIYVNC